MTGAIWATLLYAVIMAFFWFGSDRDDKDKRGVANRQESTGVEIQAAIRAETRTAICAGVTAMLVVFFIVLVVARELAPMAGDAFAWAFA